MVFWYRKKFPEGQAAFKKLQSLNDKTSIMRKWNRELTNSKILSEDSRSFFSSKTSMKILRNTPHIHNLNLFTTTLLQERKNKKMLSVNDFLEAFDTLN